MADYNVELIAASDLIYELDVDEANVELIAATDLIYELEVGGGGSEQTVVNRVWDTVAAGFVRWVTSQIDSAGSSYPGPGTFGVDTSDYVVETIQHTRV
jgi:hypothetical protein